ncbi:hypothetical protein [Pontibacter vulgaris]|uniref:hypothetical protein n=1 Tax=Pontibacter vulgaris TaxID=2905679 RepID=UPI001FA75634|nr:hypothetical protein [Pontibacter vulgaris]
MPKVRFLLLCLLALAPALLCAQSPVQSLRLELPYKIEDTEVQVIALPDSSLLVYSKTDNAWGTKATFLLEKYNHKLEKVWSKNLDLEAADQYIRYTTEEPYTYFAFQNANPDEYKFLRIDMATGALQVTELEVELDFLYEFKVLQGKYFLIGRKGTDEKPLLLHANPEKKEVKQLPSIYGNQSTFSDLLADPEHNRMDVVLTESNGRISRLQVKSFAADGELISNHFILQKPDKSLLSAEVTPGDSSGKMLFGTYGTRDLRFMQGFFAAPVASQVVEGQFYSLLQLKNFFKFISPKREKRLRAREADRQKTGKEPGYHYRVLLHDLITTPEGYILPLEVYFPQYQNTSTYFNMSIRTAGARPMEGYKRTHAVALAFDKNGTLLWDNCFKLKDVVTLELTHALEVGYSPDGKVIMAYPENGKIKYSIMHQDEYNDKENELELLSYDKKDKISTTEETGIRKWYGSHFAAFGFQRIRSGEDGGRSVFFINKISF